MPAEMNLLAEMTQAARSTLPEGAFFRRDRGDALFVTDFSGEVPGFTRIPRGRLTALLPEPEWLTRYEQNRDADAFAASLTRFASQTPSEAAVRLFARGAKLLGGCTREEFAAFDRAVRQTAAAALRTRSGGGVYALALLRSELTQIIR